MKRIQLLIFMFILFFSHFSVLAERIDEKFINDKMIDIGMFNKFNQLSYWVENELNTTPDSPRQFGVLSTYNFFHPNPYRSILLGVVSVINNDYALGDVYSLYGGKGYFHGKIGTLDYLYAGNSTESRQGADSSYPKHVDNCLDVRTKQTEGLISQYDFWSEEEGTISQELKYTRKMYPSDTREVTNVIRESNGEEFYSRRTEDFAYSNNIRFKRQVSIDRWLNIDGETVVKRTTSVPEIPVPTGFDGQVCKGFHIKIPPHYRMTDITYFSNGEAYHHEQDKKHVAGYTLTVDWVDDTIDVGGLAYGAYAVTKRGDDSIKRTWYSSRSNERLRVTGFERFLQLREQFTEKDTNLSDEQIDIGLKFNLNF